ncbi:MAG TPA: amino acid permease [Candidatus Limnocylindrales bacterium]|nr:amino acid permease [Candidatus Limnocylindrales bacterium]
MPRGEPQAVLGLHDAVAIIVGIVIGAGIFKAPALVAVMAGSPGWMFGAWALGGLVSLIGALCYAELATAYPHAGGDYHFLHRAFGRDVSFLFGWARFSVITTGSIALLAFVFGDYVSEVLPLGPRGPALYAAAVVTVLTWVNLRGIKTSAAAQTGFTVIEVAGLLLIVVAGLFLLGNGSGAAAVTAPAAPASAPSLASFGVAMVFVLLTYGGWNDAAYISAELKDGRRNMVRALVLSIAIITTLYLLVTWAYWRGLGLEGMAKSEAIASDLLRVAFGETAGILIAIMVAIAALTSINATMIVGARTSFAVGRDWPVLGRLGHWDESRGRPVTALLLQGAAALLLVAIGAFGGGGFRTMVEFTAPVFWLFFLLSGLSLFVLRAREPQIERPFKVPLYPLLPLIFVAVCAYMLWSSLSFVYSQALGGFNAAWIGVGVLAIGGVLLLVARRSAPPLSQPPPR